VFAFFIGCQNTITDPVVPDQDSYNSPAGENVTYKTIISTWPGYIRLHHDVFDPSHPQLDGVLLNGMIKYKMDSRVPSQDETYLDMKVNIFVDTEIRSGCPRQKCTPSVTAFVNEKVRLSSTNDEVYNVEKVFVVSNPCCGAIKLVLTFGIQKDNVTLLSYVIRPLGGKPTPIKY
jgi:hypothetical protein